MNARRAYIPGAYTLLAADAAIALTVASQHRILTYNAGAWYIGSVVALLVAHAILVGSLVQRREHGPAYKIALASGIASGILWSFSLLIEVFARRHGIALIAMTAPLLLGGFLAWGIAARVAFTRTQSRTSAILTALLSTTLGLAVVLLVGFSLCLTSLSTLAENINGSPEFIESGWHSLSAFAVANTLDAARTHLIVAPLVSAVIAIVVTARKRARELNP